MEHFDIAQWTDYVHRLVPPLVRDLMDCHLREGCEPCCGLAELVTRIKEVSSSEPRVPDRLVYAAKAVFRSDRFAPETSDWTALPMLVAKLVFDSLGRPATEGTRSASEADEHMVYHAGDYSIDLQVERDPESNEMALMGQLANRSRSGCPIPGVPVLLTARAKLLARAESNRVGEFCLVVRAREGLTLRVPMEGDGQQVVIPLAGIVGESQ